mmetsp:Transcript_71431/g.232110  ORF Transcript_71431/g.232110 Transcript_71431/m.232110 type:complete len:236 (+) Transcript_71431:632-1339(+)
MDLLVLRTVQSLEDRQDEVLRHPAGHEGRPELRHSDGALAIRVNGHELLPHRRLLIAGKGPRHHLHDRSAQIRGLREANEGGHNLRLDLGCSSVPVARAAFRDERMSEGIEGGHSRLRVDRQQFLHELLRFPRESGPIDDFFLHPVSSLDFADLLWLWPAEWHPPCQQDEGQHAEAPEVALRTIGRTEVQDLRSHVRQRSHEGLHPCVLRRPELAETKVDQLEVVAVRPLVQEVL